ncbi:hypothetical protein [Flavobacterium macacae]|uniref:Uncharacterized protein n=1 Tax=Flavobacterium macacae TaxID=2488993 RepID=A0A3P3WAR2_9FLAO|nr:hypothetical protein [Flavobacterium macacae]RRJ89723.1 hypothetical protein EG849_11970 [Flavobacterium macacae]
MFNEEYLHNALNHLTKVDGFTDFYNNYVESHDVHSSAQLEEFYHAFKCHLVEQGNWNNDLEITLNIIFEQANDLKERKSSAPIFIINEAKKINDSWIADFHRDYSKCTTGESFATEIKPGRYKTYREYDIFYGVDGSKLKAVYSKYRDYKHPYVSYTIGSAMYKAQNYSEGLPLMHEGLKNIISYPNYYWNSEYAIEGATWLIGDLLQLLNDKFDSDFRIEKIKLLKIMFLFMTRYICMTRSNMKTIDFYSNRARIVKANYYEFISIFGLGVNPDIQFISDMYLAYKVADEHRLTSIPPFMQLYWESKKMYDHGSHVPNNSGGYKEIEDKTWMQCVKVGELRSIILAEKLLKEFENYELNISNIKLNEIFQQLKENVKDGFDDFIKKLIDNKLK